MILLQVIIAPVVDLAKLYAILHVIYPTRFVFYLYSNHQTKIVLIILFSVNLALPTLHQRGGITDL